MNQTPHLLRPVQMRSHKLHRRRRQPTLGTFAVLEPGFRVDDVFHRNDLITTSKFATAIRLDLVVRLSEFVRTALAAQPLSPAGGLAMFTSFAHQIWNVFVSSFDFRQKHDFSDACIG